LDGLVAEWCSSSSIGMLLLLLTKPGFFDQPQLAAIPYSIISHTNPPLLYLQVRQNKLGKVGICPDFFFFLTRHK
jgi:hypothetical protein